MQICGRINKDSAPLFFHWSREEVGPATGCSCGQIMRKSCAHRVESKARASGAQNSRLSVHRLVSPAKRSLAKSLPELMIEVFTFLPLKSSNWSTIRETRRGDTTTSFEIPSSAQLEVQYERLTKTFSKSC